LASKSKALDI
jgi:uncharacterized protein with gpF-like domain